MNHAWAWPVGVVCPYNNKKESIPSQPTLPLQSSPPSFLLTIGALRFTSSTHSIQISSTPPPPLLLASNSYAFWNSGGPNSTPLLPLAKWLQSPGNIVDLLFSPQESQLMRSLSLSLKFMIHFWSFLLPSANIFLYFFSPCYLLLIYFSFFLRNV